MAMADKESSPLIFSHFSTNPHLLLVILLPLIEYATPSWVLSPYHHVQSIGKSHQEFLTHHPLIDHCNYWFMSKPSLVFKVSIFVLFIISFIRNGPGR